MEYLLFFVGVAACALSFFVTMAWVERNGEAPHAIAASILLGIGATCFYSLFGM